MTIGLAIKAARIKMGLSQRQVAAKAFMKRTNVSAIENGYRQPDIDTLNRIGEAIGIESWRILRFSKRQEVSQIVTRIDSTFNQEQPMQ